MRRLIHQIMTTMPRLTTILTVCIFICVLDHYEHIISAPKTFDRFYIIYTLYINAQNGSFLYNTSLGNSSIEELETFLREKESEDEKSGLDGTDSESTVSTNPNKVHLIPLIYTIFVHFELRTNSVTKILSIRAIYICVELLILILN